jgi:hypothetical protein
METYSTNRVDLRRAFYVGTRFPHYPIVRIETFIARFSALSVPTIPGDKAIVGTHRVYMFIARLYRFGTMNAAVTLTGASHFFG